MKQKVPLVTLILCAFFVQSISAQSTLYVKNKTGTQTAIALSSMKKLTFPTGNMQINKNDGTSQAYALSDVRYLNFDNLTTVSETAFNETENVQLYPNPANNELQISYQLTNAESLQIDIIDIQGKVLQQHIQNSNTETNVLALDITLLPQGLYVCRLQTNNKIETIKFIKN